MAHPTGTSIHGGESGAWAVWASPLLTVICNFLGDTVPAVTSVGRPGLGYSHSSPNTRGGPSFGADTLRAGRWAHQRRSGLTQGSVTTSASRALGS